MIFLQIDSTTARHIADFASERFWQSGEFWINFTIGLAGLVIGWLAYREAHKAFGEAGQARLAATAARDAAVRAGKTVKKQSIILAISETIRMCQIRGNTSFEDTNTKLTEINGKVRNIIGLYREDLGQSHQTLLQQIESCNSDILTQFNLLDIDIENKTIYNHIRPYVSILVGHLNELQGVLENELIITN